VAETYRDIEVSIVRWVDDEPQPGIVEFEFSDRFGRQWRFHEKQAYVLDSSQGADSVYPQPGTLRCKLLSQGEDRDGRAIAEIDTSQPLGVESLDGTSRFQVFFSQFLPERQPS
jgi:hypothetical protein